MLTPKFVAFALFILLSACAPHTKQSIEPLELPSSFSAVENANPVSTTRWWLTFNDPNLNRLEDQLFKSNLNLAQGHARLRQAEALMRQVQSFNYPTLTIDGQTGRSSQPARSGNSVGGSSQLSVSAGFELDLFGKLSSQSQAALISYKASNNDLQSLYMSLSAQLADLYFLAIEQRAQRALTDDTIATYADSLQRVEDRYRQGLAAAVDLYQARLNLAAAKAKRPIYEQGLAVAENALSLLLGSYPGSLTFLDQAYIPEAPPQLPIGLPAALLQNRPDLQAAYLRVEAQDAEVAAAIADRFPSFSLLGSYGGSRSDLTGTLINGDFWSLLLRLSQPVFDGGRRKAEVARNQARFAETLAAYQETVLRSFQEVEDALSGNRTTAIRISHLTDQEQASASSQRLALDRYMFGLTDYLPVLTAQIFYFNAQSQQLEARRQLLSQRISLARSLGGGWMTTQLETDHQHQGEQGNVQ